MLKFTNAERTSATFNGVSFRLESPGDWDSIGDGPTRDAVKQWLAKGNTPELAEAPDHSGTKWVEIKVERDRRKVNGVNVGAYWFHTDDRSCIQYGILDRKAARFNLPDTFVLHPKWKTMSGVKTPMTVGLLRQVLDAGIVLESELHDMAEQHKAAVQISADPADYDFSAGWPKTFGE